jgi:integrase
VLIKIIWKGDFMGLVEAIKNKEDIEKLKSILRKQSYRNFLLFCVGINSGLRISDILQLNISDVKNKEYISIMEKKTNKHKKFPINSTLKLMFKKFTNGKSVNLPLFRTKFNNRLDRFEAFRILKRVAKEANIDLNIGTHTLRKTFGYHHYKQFKDIVILQKIFNHYSPQTTLRYIGIEQDEINDTYVKFML